MHRNSCSFTKWSVPSSISVIHFCIRRNVQNHIFQHVCMSRSKSKANVDSDNSVMMRFVSLPPLPVHVLLILYFVVVVVVGLTSGGQWYTVIWKIFVVKKFLYSSKITRIKHTKYFQRTHYVIEHELNYRRVRKFFNMNILHTNIFDLKIFQTTVP